MVATERTAKLYANINVVRDYHPRTYMLDNDKNMIFRKVHIRENATIWSNIMKGCEEWLCYVITLQKR